MDAGILAEYAERVYAWAVRRTYTTDEAEELSQQILFAAVRAIPNLRDESRFEPWLWGLAANVTRSFRRKMGRQRAMFSCDMPDEIADEWDPGENAEREELESRLRAKIAMLAENYRNLLILRYYDGLSTKEISSRLGIPEGTVAWRLSEARRKLRKELDTMEETALKPVDLQVDYFGLWGGGSRYAPVVFVRDALAKNIFYHCYEEARSVEELAKITGVPAYYIEDRTADLVRRNALTVTPRGKYLTDFLILTDRDAEWFRTHAEREIGPIWENIADALARIASDAGKIPFYRGDRSEENLGWLFRFMASETARALWNPLPLPDPPLNYDGQNWGYLGNAQTGKVRPVRISSNKCRNAAGERGRFSHTAYGGVGGIRVVGPGWHTWIDACEDILFRGGSEDKEAVAACVREGYVRKDGDRFTVRVPVFTLEDKRTFDGLCGTHLGPVKEDLSEAALALAEGYAKLFPARLAEIAKMPVYWIYQRLFALVMQKEAEGGRLPLLPEGEVCDVLVQFRE